MMPSAPMLNAGTNLLKTSCVVLFVRSCNTQLNSHVAKHLL